jgi:hypothetical protein
VANASMASAEDDAEPATSLVVEVEGTRSSSAHPRDAVSSPSLPKVPRWAQIVSQGSVGGQRVFCLVMFAAKLRRGMCALESRLDFGAVAHTDTTV